jgi:hypothetical protein
MLEKSNFQNTLSMKYAVMRACLCLYDPTLGGNGCPTEPYARSGSADYHFPGMLSRKHYNFFVLVLLVYTKV